MKIFVSNNPDVPEPFTEYFTFNKISFSEIDLWSNDIDINGRFDISETIAMEENQLLVIGVQTFDQILQWNWSLPLPLQYRNLKTFCKNKNHMLVYSYDDSYFWVLENIKKLQQLDQSISYNSITIFIEVVPTPSSPINSFKNIKFTPWEGHKFFFRMPRIQNASLDKKNCQKDFLLTTILHNYRPHRKLLYKEMQSRANLLEKGHAYFNRPGQAMVGELGPCKNWPRETPPMDLYLDSWLEVVPETCYNHAYKFTEKTARSIQTKTPFLVLSTPGYLEYLRSLGFKTFSNLIDESYNEQYRINDRAKRLVDTLEHIIKQGSQEFYEASKEILDHNHSRLCELVGSKTYFEDLFVRQQLEKYFR